MGTNKTLAVVLPGAAAPRGQFVGAAECVKELEKSLTFLRELLDICLVVCFYLAKNLKTSLQSKFQV